MTEFAQLCLEIFRPFADFRRNWSKTLDSARYFFYNMGRNNNRLCLSNREYKGIMTRSQLITKVANDTGMTSGEVEKVMDCIFGTIGDVLKGGDKVTIAGFGRFEMRERQTKNFTNPKTKVTSKLEPTAIPGFKASGRLKEKVAQ